MSATVIDLDQEGPASILRIEGDITNGACGLHFTVVKKDS